MADFGITPKGFRRKTYAQLIDEMRVRAREIFGKDIDLSQPNILTFLIETIALPASEVWELAEDVFLSGTTVYATGEALSNLASNIGIERREATASRGYAVFKGEDDTVIRQYTRISTVKGEQFFVDETVTIKDGTARAKIESVSVGIDTNVLSNSLTELETQIVGVESVTNPEDTTGGQDIETDAELYDRYILSVTKGGGSTASAIRAALLATDGILDADVLENVAEVEVDGIPMKSIAPLVYGGEDEQVARVILEHKAGGIRSFGSTKVDIEDADEMVQTIGFTRVKTVDIYVKLTFSEPIDNDVATRAVYNYIGGTDEDSITYKGLGLSRDVTLAGVVGAIMCLNLVSDVGVQLSTDGETWQHNNIEIDNSSVANCKGVTIINE